jgi:hypothetical protein
MKIYSVSTLPEKQQAYDVDGYLNMRSDAMASLYTTHANQPEYYKDPRTLKNVDVQTWLKYDGAGVPDQCRSGGILVAAVEFISG